MFGQVCMNSLVCACVRHIDCTVDCVRALVFVSVYKHCTRRPAAQSPLRHFEFLNACSTKQGSDLTYFIYYSVFSGNSLLFLYYFLLLLCFLFIFSVYSHSIPVYVYPSASALLFFILFYVCVLFCFHLFCMKI